jgi:predicted ABC-type ATPase
MTMNTTNERLEALKQIYALPEDQAALISRHIISIFTQNKRPVDQPHAVMIGAPPGAGKSCLQQLAHKELCCNTVSCNVDNLRHFHPQAAEILRWHEKDYAELTSPYARRWKDDLVRHCLVNRLHYIHESTFHNAENLNRSMREAKANGFGITVKLLAVQSRLSLLGTHLRFEQMKRVAGTGRHVSRQFHDLSYTNLPFTIQKMKDAGVYDEMEIYTRSAVLQNTSFIEGINLVARNPIDPRAIYLMESHRPWEHNMELYFREKCQLVLDLMAERNASDQEVKLFKKDMGIPFWTRKHVRIRR